MLTKHMAETNTLIEIIQQAKIGVIHPSLITPQGFLEQNKFEKLQDYAAKVELALYKLVNEMTKDKTVTESRTITKVMTSQAQNIFVDGLYFQIRTNFGHLSRDCKKPKNTNNIGSKTETVIKKEYSGSSSEYTSLQCNYCKKPGHIVKYCRKLKFNNEQKVKSEGASTSAVMKTIGDMKNNAILVALAGKENIFLIDTGADLNIIKLSAVKDNVPVETKTTSLIDHLNKEELKALSDVCYEYSDIFFEEDDKVIGTDLVTHRIITPINTRQYRLAEQQKNEIDRQVTDLEQQKLIKKKGNSWPLSLITDILDKLGHSKYFSTLDFANGYHQISIHPEDTYKTAFSTSTEHWEWLKMHFGLKTAPAVFSELLHALLSGCEDLNMYAYLDDIVISAESLSSMIKKTINYIRET
ncbi:hypothetical protein QTP88_029539 [Uroleucon formosanum]